MVLLEIVGMMALGLGTTALVTGVLPVTAHRFIRGRAAKRIGWCCWLFGLLCMLAWAGSAIWYTFFRAV
jgi:hypothetical protein